jgi:hypothetical protein
MYALCGAQEVMSARILSLRINGTRQCNFPVASLRGDPITVSFDVKERTAPEFYLRVYHCDRDWHRTENNFINDLFRTVAKHPIPHTFPPSLVQGYTHSYSFRLPGAFGIEEFSYSGNYQFEIWEKQTELLLARGRFFVAEDRQSVSMRVFNRQLPSATIPENHVHKVVVSLNVQEEGTSELDRIPFNQVRVVDVVKNRAISNPFRIDVDDRNANTFVDGFGTPRLSFVLDDLLPGNEYRTLDLTDIDFYPQGKELRARDGADVSRNFHLGEKDQDGKSTLVSGTRYADYVVYRFELLREAQDAKSVFVVSDFNGWQIREQFKMKYDVSTKRYLLPVSIRRGVYDYEYVSGSGNNISLEGNDWRTVNVYTALVYYRDPQFGGFDRIIGFAQARNVNVDQATSE